MEVVCHLGAVIFSRDSSITPVSKLYTPIYFIMSSQNQKKNIPKQRKQTQPAHPKKKKKQNRNRRATLGLNIKTPSKADYDFSLIQSRADTRPFDYSFEITDLSLAPRGQILFEQSISAASIALMQQQSNDSSAEDVSTMMNGILNYLEYRFHTLTFNLISSVAEGVSGEIAVLFLPPSVTVNASNFVKIVMARKGLPGTTIFNIETLHSKKKLSFRAEYFKGGRPIGLASVADANNAVVGRIVIGVVTTPLSSATTIINAPGSSSSSSSSGSAASVTGPLAILNARVTGEWILYTPDQVPNEYAIDTLQIKLSTSSDSQRVDPIGPGDYVCSTATGVTPPIIARLASNDLRRRTTDPVVAPNNVIPTQLADGNDIVSWFQATTIRGISNTVIEAVAEFAPPGIRQLIIWGGRIMLGMADRFVGSQDTLLAKDQRMVIDNQIGPFLGSGDVDISQGLSLTPPQTYFSPNTQPYYEVPVSPCVGSFLSQLYAAPVGSVARNLATFITFGINYGLYPMIFSADYDSAFSSSFSTIVDMLTDVFVRDFGGVPSLIRTELIPSTTPADTFAGIPLSIKGLKSSNIKSLSAPNSKPIVGLTVYGSSVEPPFPRPQTRKRKTNFAIFEENIIDFHKVRTSLALGPWGDSFLQDLIAWDTAHPLATHYDKHKFICDWFGMEGSYDDEGFSVFTFRFSYAARGITGSDPNLLLNPLPAGMNDNGYMDFTYYLDLEELSTDYVLTAEHHALRQITGGQVLSNMSFINMVDQLAYYDINLDTLDYV